MSDNWNPPPRDPSEPEGEQPTERPDSSRRDGQSPLWWTESTEKPQEYLQPGPPAGPPTPSASDQGGSDQNDPDQPSGSGAGKGGSGDTGWSRPGEGGSTGWSNPAWDRPPYSTQPPPARPPLNSPPRPSQPGSAQRGPGRFSTPQPGAGHPGPAQPGGAQPGRPVGQDAAPAPGTPRHGGPPAPGSQGPARGSGAPSSPWPAAAPGAYPAYQQGVQPGGPPGGGFPPGGQQPSWQYPPIPIPQPPGNGRRSKPRSTPKGLLIGLVVLAVLVVGTGVTYALRNSGDGTQPVAVDTPSETPSVTPSESPSPTPTPTVKQTTKPKPKPRQPTPYELVAKNKLYAIGQLQASKCTEPPYRPTTFAAVKAYYNRMLPCLNRTWWLAMKKAGVPFRAPHVIVYANTVKTPCGVERGTRGFYCGANEAIYMPFNVDYKNYKINPMYTRAWMLNTFAHEYGHHVQQLSGIFGASFARQATMADPNLRLLESRKRELQASCLGSAYLGADAQSIPLKGELLSSWKFAVANAGDEFAVPKVRDHGSKVNHNFWSTRGITYRDPKYCNTFSSPPQYTY